MMITAQVKMDQARNYSNLNYGARVTTFRARLSKSLELSGLNQSELARKCGIRSQTINRLLSGASHMPSSTTLLQLARELRVDVGWLTTGNGSEPTMAEKAPVIVMRSADWLTSTSSCMF